MRGRSQKLRSSPCFRKMVNIEKIVEKERAQDLPPRDIEVDVHFTECFDISRQGALAQNLKFQARLFIYLEMSTQLLPHLPPSFPKLVSRTAFSLCSTTFNPNARMKALWTGNGKHKALLTQSHHFLSSSHIKDRNVRSRFTWELPKVTS